MKIALFILIGLALFVLVAFFILGKKSQTGVAPGLTGGHLTPCGSKPNCVCSEQDRSLAMKTNVGANIAPLDLSWDELKTAIKAQGGVIVKEEDGYLSATFTSKAFKFVDDFEARQDGDVIHIRSASRVGYSDRGVNRTRVNDLRFALQ